MESLDCDVVLGAKRLNIAGLWHPGSSAWGGRGRGLGAKSRVYDAFWHPDDCCVFGWNAALGAKRLLSIAV